MSRFIKVGEQIINVDKIIRIEHLPKMWLVIRGWGQFLAEYPIQPEYDYPIENEYRPTNLALRISFDNGSCVDLWDEGAEKVIDMLGLAPWPDSPPDPIEAKTTSVYDEDEVSF